MARLPHWLSMLALDRTVGTTMDVRCMPVVHRVDSRVVRGVVDRVLSWSGPPGTCGDGQSTIPAGAPRILPLGPRGRFKQRVEGLRPPGELLDCTEAARRASPAVPGRPSTKLDRAVCP